LVDAAYRDKTLSIGQINCIIKAVTEGKNTSDQRHSSAKKTKWTSNVLASMAAVIENDWRIGTVHAILKRQFGPGKEVGLLSP
jgi:hypothetical protein